MVLATERVKKGQSRFGWKWENNWPRQATRPERGSWDFEC